jgi:integrase
MSVYLVKGKGWRYDFTLNGQRYTAAWFKNRAETYLAEARKREEVKNGAESVNPPPPPTITTEAEAKAVATPTDMAFLELINKRLDYLKTYKSKTHYVQNEHMAKRLLKEWPGVSCRQVTPDMVQRYIARRGATAPSQANKELRCLKAMFNFGIKMGLIQTNPTQGLEFIPVERRLRYIPPKEDIAKVLLGADPDTQDYLLAVVDTLARVGEINRLTWNDVDFAGKYLVLYTRKKKGGHLTPRKVAMTGRLFAMLQKRFRQRDPGKPWVFWKRAWSRKEGKFVTGPFEYRKSLMATLCRKAGVRHFAFHALRHFGASLLDQAKVPLGAIQRILGHESRTTTEIYLHSMGEMEREAMEVFERISTGAAPEGESHIDSHINSPGAAPKRRKGPGRGPSPGAPGGHPATHGTREPSHRRDQSPPQRRRPARGQGGKTSTGTSPEGESHTDSHTDSHIKSHTTAPKTRKGPGQMA